MEVYTQLDSIEIVQPPATEQFCTVMGFDQTGMSVIAHYSDGHEADITDACRFESPDMSRSGSERVSVRYSENGLERTAYQYIEIGLPYVKCAQEDMDSA